MKTPEAAIKDEIKAYLKRIGAYFFLPVQVGYGMTTLDILCCVNGRFLGIEVKAPGKKPTPRQMLTIGHIQAARGAASWFDNAKDAIEWISLVSVNVVDRS